MAAARQGQYNQVTVLFTDFVNFTGISEKLTAHEVVSEIDHCFKGFDEIIETHGLEKIKTIGDAYLAVCGLPNESADHAVKAVRCLPDIIKFMIAIWQPVLLSQHDRRFHSAGHKLRGKHRQLS